MRRPSAGDLPPLHVEAEKGRRKKKHRPDRGGEDGSGDDADDLSAGVGQAAAAKMFQVKKVDDMPSGAESSDDEVQSTR